MMNETNAELKACAAAALRDCLDLKSDERLLVVVDPPCFEIGQAFWEAGVAACREAVMVQISPRSENGNEPPEPVGAWFGAFDAAVMPTSRSLTHTQARRDACNRGTRIATLPGITVESFLRTMKTDWRNVGLLTHAYAQRLSSTDSIRITTRAGTDLRLKTGGRKAKPDDARITEKGSYGNLPGGEAFFAPIEGSAEGTLVFDGSFPLTGLLDQPMYLTVANGRVVSVADHPCRPQLEELFVKYGPDSRTIAEMGVGTLDTAIISGNVLEDEKVLGSVHIALGDNASMGGTVHVPMHMDGIMRQPTVWLDNVQWMRDGVVAT
jgi:leucyl aminopeptidase (aminopeptidase T)